MSTITAQPVIQPIKHTSLRYPTTTSINMPSANQQPFQSIKLRHSDITIFRVPLPIPAGSKLSNPTKRIAPPRLSRALPNLFQPSHYASSKFISPLPSAYFSPTSQLAGVPNPSLLVALGLRQFIHPDFCAGAKTLKMRDENDPRNIWFRISDKQKEKFQKIMSLAQGYERNVYGVRVDGCRYFAWRELEREELKKCGNVDSVGVANKEKEKMSMKDKMVSFLEKDGEFKMGGVRQETPEKEEEDEHDNYGD